MAGELILDEGLLALLQDKIEGTLTGMSVGLFTTAHTPAFGDTASTYTAIEASWTGYARQTAGGWSSPAIVGSHVAETEADLMTFTVTSGGTGANVYGYFCVSGSDIVQAEEFASPIPVTDGVPISLLLKWHEQNP